MDFQVGFVLESFVTFGTKNTHGVPTGVFSILGTFRFFIIHSLFLALIGLDVDFNDMPAQFLRICKPDSTKLTFQLGSVGIVGATVALMQFQVVLLEEVLLTMITL